MSAHGSLPTGGALDCWQRAIRTGSGPAGPASRATSPARSSPASRGRQPSRRSTCCASSVSRSMPTRCARQSRSSHENCRWEHDGQPFFDGEVEPCINGRTVAIGAYFGARRRRHRRAAARRAARRRRLELRGRERLDALVVPHDDLRARGVARVRAGRPAARRDDVAARRRGARSICSSAGLFRRLSTGEVVDEDWLAVLVPDRGTTTCCAAWTTSATVGGAPDPRLAEAIDVVRAKQQPDGTWLLENTHRGAGALRDRGRRRPAEPVEHAARAAGAALVRRRVTSRAGASGRHPRRPCRAVPSSAR